MLIDKNTDEGVWFMNYSERHLNEAIEINIC